MRVCSTPENHRLNNVLNQGGRWIRGKLKNIKRPSNPQGGVNTSPVTEEPPSSEEVDSLVETLTFEQLLEESLYKASLVLINRENQLLGKETNNEVQKHHAEEMERLSAERRALEKKIQQTLQQSLSLRLQEVASESAVQALTALKSAVKAIYHREVQDLQRKQQKSRTLSNWKKLHDSTLHDLVESRMDQPSVAPAGQPGQSSIQLDVQGMGRQMKDDLLLVVNVLKSCYPPEANICQFYARMYHQNLSARLRKIVDFVLDDKDCAFILRWVNEYYPGILKKPELASEIDSAALGQLLPADSMDSLEEQYLTTKESELSVYLNNALEEERRKLTKGEQPPTEDGCFTSPLAVDVIPIINGMVGMAETVTGSRQKAQRITGQLTHMLQRFKAFQDDIIKQNRKPHVKATLGCVEQFRDILQRKSHLFPDDVQKNCLTVLSNMRQSACTYLLSSVHKSLKPQYQKLGTGDWLKKKSVFEMLLSSLENSIQELEGLDLSCYQGVIGDLHQEVTQQYVKRLLRGEVKLKDREHQQRAFDTVMDNAESLHKLFTSMGSQEEWLKEILTSMAEVLKLQDVPALQMQIVSLGHTYPDLSEKHVSALLKLKSNISREDRHRVKATLSDTRDKSSAGVEFRPFFSKVVVR
ncbi:tumor necrosis factor alpha-induced protein 2 [Poeciliopsis prolifica]|uniref:tumor necrosis factor alpha-induced protein 2 n=1 Tax=Poeciliopsis prolifica TaxID=188132 RepID=UPI002413F5EA|nr:tumor necrosis factor alpha-induced protein 2 [Poeciliopsis prolifica]